MNGTREQRRARIKAIRAAHIARNSRVETQVKGVPVVLQVVFADTDDAVQMQVSAWHRFTPQLPEGFAETMQEAIWTFFEGVRARMIEAGISVGETSKPVSPP